MTEIGDDNASAIIQGSHKYVVRLQVAMNDVTVVKILDTHQHLSDYYRSFNIVKAPSLELHI